MAGSYWQMITDALQENKQIIADKRKEQRENGAGFFQKLTDARLFSYKNNYDDRIEIQSGTKTLLGEDFSSLYESCEVASIDAGQGASANVIKATCSYPTEMHSGNLVMGDWTEYASVPVEKKACYEVALLTKKYAALPESDENAKAYADKMAHYRQFCEANGIDWSTVIYNVSGELQTEVADYKELGDDKLNLYDQVTKNADLARSQAADAHNMLLTCAPDGYTDWLLPSLEGKVTYKETTDTTYDVSFRAKSVSFFAVIHAAFIAIYNKLPHPIKWMKSVFNNMKHESRCIAENMKGLMQDFESESEARIREGEKIYEQINGIGTDLSNTSAGQTIQNAKGAIKNEVQQIWTDPSQEIKDARDKVSDKAKQVKPYLDAAGNMLDATGKKIKGRADEFVDKWAATDKGSLSESGNEITGP